jgi:hypothetical protein
MGTASAAETLKSFFDFDKFKTENSFSFQETPIEKVVTENPKPSEDLLPETPLSKEEKQKEKAEQKTDAKKDEKAPDPAANIKALVASINPELALTMFDVIVSRAFSVGTGWFGYQGVSYKDYKLDESEKKTLAPFFEMYVVEWLKSLSPRDVFAIVILFIYGGKVMTVTSNKPRKKKAPRNEKKNSGSESDYKEAESEETDSSDTTPIRYNKDGSIAKKRGPKGQGK